MSVLAEMRLARVSQVGILSKKHMPNHANAGECKIIDGPSLRQQLPNKYNKHQKTMCVLLFHHDIGSMSGIYANIAMENHHF